MAPLLYPSLRRTLIPSVWQSSSNSFELDCPKREFSKRMTAVFGLTTSWRKVTTAAGYSLAGGLIRKTYSYPLSVILSAEPVVTRNGTLNCWATAVAAAVTELEYPPVMMGTFSWEISFSVADRPTSGFPVSSSKSSSSLFPLTPPFALISSAAMRKDRFSISPNFACSPVNGSTMPTLIVWAIATALPRLTAKAIAIHTNNTLFLTLIELPPFLVDALLRVARPRKVVTCIFIPFRYGFQPLFNQEKHVLPPTPP